MFMMTSILCIVYIDYILSFSTYYIIWSISVSVDSFLENSSFYLIFPLSCRFLYIHEISSHDINEWFCCFPFLIYKSVSCIWSYHLQVFWMMNICLDSFWFSGSFCLCHKLSIYFAYYSVLGFWTWLSVLDDCIISFLFYSVLE